MKFKQPSLGTKLVTLHVNLRPKPIAAPSGDILLSILDELNTDTLSHSRVGLFSLNPNFLQDDALAVRGSLKRGRFPGGAEGAFSVVVVCPSVFATVDAEFACCVETCGFAFTHRCRRLVMLVDSPCWRSP